MKRIINLILDLILEWYRQERLCDDANIDELCGHDWNPSPTTTTMTEEQQRIAIAEACNLFRLAPLKRTTRKGDVAPNGVKLWYCIENFGGAKEYAEVPFYTKCLNACRKMVEVLDYEQAELYEDELCDLVKKELEATENPAPFRFAVCNASAAIRCKAFLKTLNRWIA